MGVYTGDNNLVITEPKNYFDLPKYAGINLKHERYAIIKHEFLAEDTIKIGSYSYS